MLYQWIRLLRGTNGVLSDLSLANQDETATCLHDVTAATDYLYLGQQFPFNNFYYKMAVANALASTLSIEYWTGSAWVSAVDVLDGTRPSAATLARSGMIQFSPNQRDRWQIVYDSSEVNVAPAELNSVTIYNMYWIRIKFSANLTPTAASKKICYCFSTHQQIAHRDSTLNTYLASFGVTTWEDHIINASIDVIQELKKRNLITNSGQVLRLDDVTIATDWKTVMSIYFDLGGDYLPKLTAATRMFDNALDLKTANFDKNNNAVVDISEKDSSQTRMSRG